MQTTLPEIEIPGPEGWRITPDTPPNAVAMGTHKGFTAVPVDDLIVDYVTVEKYRGQIIDVVYPARILQVHASFWWDEGKQNWRASSPNIRVRLLNPKTMKPFGYHNPRNADVNVRDLFFAGEIDELPNSRKGIVKAVLAATQPKTKITITVTEEPIDD